MCPTPGVMVLATTVHTGQPCRAGLPLPVGFIDSFSQPLQVMGAGDGCSRAQDSCGPCPWSSQPRGQQGSTTEEEPWPRGQGPARTRPRGIE